MSFKNILLVSFSLILFSGCFSFGSKNLGDLESVDHNVTSGYIKKIDDVKYADIVMENRMQFIQGKIVNGILTPAFSEDSYPFVMQGANCIFKANAKSDLLTKRVNIELVGGECIYQDKIKYIKSIDAWGYGLDNFFGIEGDWIYSEGTMSKTIEEKVKDKKISAKSAQQLYDAQMRGSVTYKIDPGTYLNILITNIEFKK
jgi:hypothetical protein